MRTQNIGKWRITLQDNSGYRNYPFQVQIYNMNCKLYNQLKYNYVFQTVEEAEKYIQQKIDGIHAHDKRKEERKQERKLERKNFKNPAKVGDVLRASWGYDQTNVDYFQVVKVSGKCVWIREIWPHHVEGSTYSHGMADAVVPAVGNFKKDGLWTGSENAPIKKVVNGSSYKDYFVSISSFASAYKTDENEQTYRSWYA